MATRERHPPCNLKMSTCHLFFCTNSSPLCGCHVSRQTRKHRMSKPTSKPKTLESQSAKRFSRKHTVINQHAPIENGDQNAVPTNLFQTCGCETGAPLQQITVTWLGLKIVSVVPESERLASMSHRVHVSAMMPRVKTAKHNHCNVNRIRSLVPAVLSSSIFMGSSFSENVLKCHLVVPSISALIPFRSSLRKLAIPFCSRVIIPQSPLAISLLCLEYKFCC